MENKIYFILSGQFKIKRRSEETDLKYFVKILSSNVNPSIR